MFNQIFKRFGVFSAAGTALLGALLMIVLLLAPVSALAEVAVGKVTTNHWKKGALEGYSLTATVTVPAAQADFAEMKLSGPQLADRVSLVADAAGTTYSATVELASRPSVGAAYTLEVTYFDDPVTPPETLTLAVSAVFDSFAPLVSPAWGVAGVANPTFTWQAAAGAAGYRLSITGLDELPWVSAQLLPATLSAQYSQTQGFPSSLSSGVTYGWSVYALDADGNSAENRDGLVMTGANISGKVTTFGGGPVAGATVSVFNTLGQSVTSATTRDDGSYVVGGLTSTNFWLRFAKDGRVVYYNNRLDASENFLAAATQLKTGVDAVLGGWGAISGKVTTSTGAGLTGYQVVLLDANGAATSYPAATTATGGAFSFKLLAPGLYRLRVIGANGYATLDYGTTLSVSEGQITQLPADVVLYKVNISGRVTNAAGEPVAGAWVDLYTTANAFVDNFFGVQTGSDGTYAIAGIAVGSYKVMFTPPIGSGYSKQYYNRKGTLQEATAVTVGSTLVTGIDAVLGSGKPVVGEFTLPASSSSLTVTGIVLAATEPTYGVTGYLLTESGSAPAASDAGWVSTPPTSYTFTEVGEKTLYAWAKGAAGIVSDGVARSVTVTATTPAVVFSTLSDQAVTANPVLNVSGTATGSIASLTVNGQAATIAANGTFSFPLKLSAGANTVTMVATDAGGTETTTARSISYDATAPALSIAQPADNSVSATATAVVSGTVVAGTTVAVSVNGGAPVQAIVSGTEYLANVTLADGVNTIEVVAQDGQGKKNHGKRSVTLVSSLPEVAVSSPLEDRAIEKSTHTVTGSVSEGATVTIVAGGVTYTPTVSAGSFSQEVSFPARGAYPVTVTATTGNGSTTAVRNLIVERRIGDCNNSGGAVTAADLQYAINIVVKKPGFVFSTFCDVNLVNGVHTPNGTTTSTDVQTLINVLIKKTGWTLP